MSPPRKDPQAIIKQPHTIIKSEISWMCVLTNGYIASVSRSSDDSKKNNISIYDPDTGVFVDSIKIQSSRLVTFLVPLSDGRLAFDVPIRNQLQVWDPRTLKSEIIYNLNDDGGKICPLCWLDNQNGILCELGINRQSKLGVVNLDTKKFTEIPSSDESVVAAHVWNQSFITISREGRIVIRDSLTKKQTGTLSTIMDAVLWNQSSTSLMNNLLSVSSGVIGANYIEIIDLTSRNTIACFRVDNCCGAVLLPGNRLVAATYTDLQVYDLFSKEIISKFPIPDIKFMQLLPDLNLVVGGRDQLAIVNIGLQELKVAYQDYQQVLTQNTPLLQGPAGVVLEYLVDERKKIFGTRNLDEKTQDTSLSSDETPKNKDDNPSDKEAGITPKKTS